MRSIPACLLCLVILSGVMLLGCNDEDTTGLPHTGTIVIDPEPDDIDAPWQLLGPEGFDRSGAGDATLEDLVPGDYALTWGEVGGWSLPNPETVTQELPLDASATFAGTYIDRYPAPDTADQVMANFRNAYGEMDIDEYAGLLHAGFNFVFVADWQGGAEEGIFTRAEDILSTTRMFAGELGQSPDGALIPSVRSLEFRHFERLYEWEVVPDTDLRFPGALRALYDVEVVFRLNNESWWTITVDTQQLFYVMPIEEDRGDGSRQQHFYLIGQVDLGGSLLSPPLSSNEDMVWSAVKSFYYLPPDPAR